MPGGAVTAAGPAIGLIGKLPAHGDFVRRGGPAAVLASLDGWLDTELGGAMADGMPLEDAVDALDGWRFAFRETGAAIVVACASVDSVGRRFPLIAAAAAADGFEPEESERWCAAAAAALAGARDAGANADAALAAIAVIAPPRQAATAPAAGWWRAESSPSGVAALPRAAAFRALLGERA